MVYGLPLPLWHFFSIGYMNGSPLPCAPCKTNLRRARTRGATDGVVVVSLQGNLLRASPSFPTIQPCAPSIIFKNFIPVATFDSALPILSVYVNRFGLGFGRWSRVQWWAFMFGGNLLDLCWRRYSFCMCAFALHSPSASSQLLFRRACAGVGQTCGFGAWTA